MFDGMNSDKIVDVISMTLGTISSCEKSFNIRQNAFLFHLSGVMNIVYFFSEGRLFRLATGCGHRSTLSRFRSALDGYHHVGCLSPIDFLCVFFLNLPLVHERHFYLWLRAEFFHDTFQGFNVLFFFLDGNFSFIKLVSQLIQLVEQFLSF